jgi:hypothetical protein
MFGKTKHLEFLVALGLLLGVLGDPHPAYILHLKRTLLANKEFSGTLMVFAAAWQLERSARHDMRERHPTRGNASLETKVRTLRSMWAEAKTLQPRRYEEVLELLAGTQGLTAALDELKATWASGQTNGVSPEERDEASTVYRRLLFHPSYPHDPDLDPGFDCNSV